VPQPCYSFSNVPSVPPQAAQFKAARALLFFAYIAAGAAILWAADSTAQSLFNKVRANVVDNVNRFPRYTCVQTVTRSQFVLPVIGSSCATTVAAHERKVSDRALRWHDRLRLDVAVGEKSEMFSWAGASHFETGDVSQFVGHGATGSGEFGSFLASVFGGDAENFVYTGLQDTPLGRLASFNFNVPLSKSHYQYSSSGKSYITVAYHGSFYADDESGELKRLDLQTSEFSSGDVCHVADSIDYTMTKIGASQFMLPSKSSMDVIYRNATESLNETTFSGCREYVGDTTIRFDVDDDGNATGPVSKAALKPLPPHVRLRVHVDPPIDSATAAAGDQIIGVVEMPVKEKNEVIVHAGDKLHGRILRLDQTVGGLTPRWTVAILFETIERNGIEQKVLLKPSDDGDRTPLYPGRGRGSTISPITTSLTAERPAGGGIFSFIESGNLVLGKKFESDWETR
jgi:hypothetical protein